MLSSPSVVHVIRSAGVGGVETHVRALVASQQILGASPSVVSLSSEPPHKDFRELGCPVITLNDHGDWSYRTALACYALWRTLRRLRPDIVHLHGARPIFVGAIAARLAGCRAILSSLHGAHNLMAVLPDGTVSRARDRLAKFTHGVGFLLVNRIVICAEALRGDVRDAVASIWPGKTAAVLRKTHVVYHGVDCTRFHPGRVQDLAAGTQTACEPPVVGTLSRLDEPKKGIGIFLQAVAMLESRGRSVCLRIAGEGYSRQSLEKKAVELSLSDCRFLGYVGDSAQFYRSLDIFVLPSYSEGFPLSNLEAMASGAAVVTTNAGGAAEAIEQSTSGLVVPIGDAAALADALERLIDDPVLRRGIADAGRDRVQDRFSIDITCKRVMALYSEVSKTWGSKPA